MALVKNPKWEALSRLQSYVCSKNEALGFSTDSGSAAVGDLYSTAINEKNTWESPLADNQAACTKTEVDSLAATFIELTCEISSQISQLDEYIDESDPLAKWPN